MPQRGALEVAPSRSRSGMGFSLMTAPSVSYGKSSRILSSSPMARSNSSTERQCQYFSGVLKPSDFSQSSNSIRSEEHTSELQSLAYLVCRLLLEKKKELTTLARYGYRIA